MDSRPRRGTPGPVLVYDGDCGFCIRCAALVQRRLAPGIAVRPWQEAELDDRITERARQEVLLVHPDGRRVWGGADAFAVLLVAGPLRWARPLGALLRLPGARALAAAVYRAVARHRGRMPGFVCGRDDRPG